MQATRNLLFAVLLLPGLAQADMYRWIDRETGQVKFSNTPPPWFGDPVKERQNPPVEVIRYRGPVEKPKPAPQAEKAASEARTVAALEARWLELVRFFATLPRSSDLERTSPHIKQQLDTYQALAEELDRLDPGGTARRRSQEAAVIEAARRELQPEPLPRRSTE
jgi:hypothetical protein